MTKHEIERAMFADLKEQLDNYHLRDACQKGGQADAVRFYDNKISELNKHFNALIKQYETFF